MTKAVSLGAATATARARRVEEATHSVRMEGLDLAAADVADTAEYAAGAITLDEYGRRVRERYGVPEESLNPAARARPGSRNG